MKCGSLIRGFLLVIFVTCVSSLFLAGISLHQFQSMVSWVWERKDLRSILTYGTCLFWGASGRDSAAVNENAKRNNKWAVTML